MKATRRKFLEATAKVSTTALIAPSTSFTILKSKPKLEEQIIGHGEFKYRVEQEWGDLNPSTYPVNNCHEMVIDQQGRLIMLTDHPKNNILIYDKSGKLLDNWTLDFKGAHGLTIHDEGGEDYLYITDLSTEKVVKTTIAGEVVLTIDHPATSGAYGEHDKFKPTETAVGPNGDIYIADGYGSQFILQYDRQGNFIRKFGGDSFLSKEKFKQAHGVTLDTRDPENPTLICTARIKNSFKRFSLDGQYLEEYYLPGAYVSRAVIDGKNLYSGVCFSMPEGRYNMALNTGFVTILDKNNKMVSNPGGTKPKYKDNQPQLARQEKPIFKHCHDVCVDEDKNLYVCQWNAGGIYPYKLHRV
ncbi:MAG: 6-bladed beta-propeller [Cyclobacteriaceae bacterium]